MNFNGIKKNVYFIGNKIKLQLETYIIINGHITHLSQKNETIGVDDYYIPLTKLNHGKLKQIKKDLALVLY